MRAPFVSVHPVLGMPDDGNDHMGPSLCGPESGSCRQPRTLNTAALRLRYAGEATPGASVAGRDGGRDGRATGATSGSFEICLRIRCPSGERTTRSRLATSRSPARMHRSTWIDIAASLMRQDHSWPLLPDQTRKASPLRSSRIRHLRMDLVSFMLGSPSCALASTTNFNQGSL